MKDNIGCNVKSQVVSSLSQPEIESKIIQNPPYGMTFELMAGLGTSQMVYSNPVMSPVSPRNQVLASGSGEIRNDQKHTQFSTLVITLSLIQVFRSGEYSVPSILLLILPYN